MAAVIQCDACSNTCKVKEAKHIRIYNLSDAENYNNHCTKSLDVCNTCYDKLCKCLNMEAKK